MTADRLRWLWPGVPLALGSALLFGASAPLAKALLSDIDPVVLAGLLYLGAGFGLLLVRLARAASPAHRSPPEFRPADLPWLAGVVLFGGVLGPVLLMLGLMRTDASSASLLLNLEALATMVIAWVVCRENVDRRLLLGAALILAGAVALSWSGEGPRLNLGSLLVVAACLAWGIDNNLTRRLSAGDPIDLVIVKGMSAGTVNLGLGLMRAGSVPPVLDAGLALLLGFLGYGLSIALFVLALRHLGTARTSAYFSTAPFIGAALALVFLHEPASPVLLLAASLMGVGVWLHLTERHEHVHTHEPTEHTHAHVHDEHHRHEHTASDPLGEPHTHVHTHARLTHAHPHYPDLHHRHDH